MRGTRTMSMSPSWYERPALSTYQTAARAGMGMIMGMGTFGGAYPNGLAIILAALNDHDVA